MQSRHFLEKHVRVGAIVCVAQLFADPPVPLGADAETLTVPKTEHEP